MENVVKCCVNNVINRKAFHSIGMLNVPASNAANNYIFLKAVLSTELVTFKKPIKHFNQ